MPHAGKLASDSHKVGGLPQEEPPIPTDQHGIFTISESSPPSYNRPEDVPPSYDSIFNKIQKTKDESKGDETCCTFILGLIILGLLTGVLISMIAIGAMYLNRCPVQPYIPIYLVVSGSFGLIETLIVNCARSGKESEEGTESPSPCLRWFRSLIGIFLFAWLVVGSVWVYSKHGVWTSYYKSPNYCNPTLYLFTFWIVTVSYIIMGLSLLCVGCRVCCACFAPSSEDNE